MIQKKVCLIGAFAVGKTSLIKRFVESIFNEQYLTTVGVKIDKKQVEVNSQVINLILWDLAGEDDFCKLKLSYLRGASGLIIVVDPTRSNTIEVARKMKDKATEMLGDIPITVAMNKSDLRREWEIDAKDLKKIESLSTDIYHTSAKTGANVDPLFSSLASKVLKASN